MNREYEQGYLEGYKEGQMEGIRQLVHYQELEVPTFIGERQMEPWEIERECRESDEDGCLWIVLIATIITGILIGYFGRGWLGI